jgi:hypothetical protein
MPRRDSGIPRSASLRTQTSDPALASRPGSCPASSFGCLLLEAVDAALQSERPGAAHRHLFKWVGDGAPNLAAASQARSRASMRSSCEATPAARKFLRAVRVPTAYRRLARVASTSSPAARSKAPPGSGTAEGGP